jgi:hypothetical protein
MSSGKDQEALLDDLARCFVQAVLRRLTAQIPRRLESSVTPSKRQASKARRHDDRNAAPTAGPDLPDPPARVTINE